MIEISLISTVVIFKATYIISKQVHMEMLHGATGKIFTYNYDEYPVRHPKTDPTHHGSPISICTCGPTQHTAVS